MSYFDWLSESLKEKLSERVIGDPVALRGYFQVADDHGLLIPTLAAAVAVAEVWFGSRGPTLYAQGGVHRNSVSVLATFSNGRVAVLSSDLMRAPTVFETPLAALLLVGNHGTMYFTDRPGSEGTTINLGPSDNPGQRRIAVTIEDSLRRRVPIS